MLTTCRGHRLDAVTTPPSEPTTPQPPVLAGIVMMVLVVIGLFTVAGWLLGAAWALIRLGLLVAAVTAVVWAARTVRR
jgi:hypothetical protein